VETINVDSSQRASRPTPLKVPELQFLTPELVARIDALLATVGDYGEIHLVVQRGELRYINRVESYKAWNEDKTKK
jgi:hypothetical protein